MKRVKDRTDSDTRQLQLLLLLHLPMLEIHTTVMHMHHTSHLVLVMLLMMYPPELMSFLSERELATYVK